MEDTGIWRQEVMEDMETGGHRGYGDMDTGGYGGYGDMETGGYGNMSSSPSLPSKFSVQFIMIQDGGVRLQLSLTRLTSPGHIMSPESSTLMTMTINEVTFTTSQNNGHSYYHGSGWFQRIRTEVSLSLCIMHD